MIKVLKEKGEKSKGKNYRGKTGDRSAGESYETGLIFLDSLISVISAAFKRLPSP